MLRRLLVALVLPAMTFAEPDDLSQVRRAGKKFIAGLQKRSSASVMLRWLHKEAFDNPITRQITGFTGGYRDASPVEIRKYVAKALTQISTAPSAGQAGCPDRVQIRESLDAAVPPDNDLEADGFLLKRFTQQLIKEAQTAEGPEEAESKWLRGQLSRGRELFAMTLACKGFPIVLLWLRTTPRDWRIIAFGVSGQ